jgi:TRAP-type mannitol/chloroaromatic compound transport system substrate-binding protein
MVGLPNRRSFLRLFSVGAWGAFLSACVQPAPAAQPTAQPTAAAGAAAAPAAQQAPAPAAGVTNLKMQSTWPTNDIFHATFVEWGKKVEEMAGGRVKIDILPSGAVVGAFQLIDAVHQGVLDGGHGVPAYWFGKNKAASLFGTGPSYGMDAEMYLGWIRYGGGQALYDELIQQVLKLNVISFFHGPMPSQPLGWFRNEIKTADDFKGMKYRTVGMSQEIFESMGASVQAIPGGEVVPSLERGVIEAAEFNNPSSDLSLGFTDVRKVYMVGSYHQQSEFLELLVNKQKWDSLPKDIQAMIRYATMAESADFTWRMLDRNSKDLQEMKSNRGVKVVRTPDSILEAQLKAWDTIVSKESADPFFKKVIDSQKAWAERTVKLRQEIPTDTPNSMAARYWWKS